MSPVFSLFDVKPFIIRPLEWLTNGVFVKILLIGGLHATRVEAHALEFSWELTVNVTSRLLNRTFFCFILVHILSVTKYILC